MIITTFNKEHLAAAREMALLNYAEERAAVQALPEIAREGETFITKREEMQNIRGAYCRPEYRGQQIMQRLVEWTGNVLYKEGSQYLGVDYESFNPTAYHFWPKMFDPYTCSVTRRIGEGILKKVRD
ncbi:MAG: hypothetical protein IJ315_02280 [Firmicutes bacterium]|nr:hypothetical protein [Bacillota bacterium]